MPIIGAIHSACIAVSRAISNSWTAGFVLSASHKIPKGALMAICNLQRQVMIFHILRRSGFGSKLSSLIISIGSTRNMADFMEKWRPCWNGSLCVDPSDVAHASVPYSVTNICCSSFMAIVIQLKLDFPSSFINWRCVINRQRQASWSWCTGCVHSCEARCGLPCRGGTRPCCESTGDLQTSAESIHRSGERWTTSTLIRSRTLPTSEPTDWCIGWNQSLDHSAFLDSHESNGSPSGVRAITPDAKSIEAATHQ